MNIYFATNIVPSMVQKKLMHIKNDQKNKALEMLSAVAPEIGKLVRQFALEEKESKIDGAYELISEFKQTYPFFSKVLSNERDIHIKLLRQEHLRRILVEEERRSILVTDVENEPYDNDSNKELITKKKSQRFKRKKEKYRNKYRAKKDLALRNHNYRKFGSIHKTELNNIIHGFLKWLIDVKNARVDNLSKKDSQFLIKEFLESLKMISIPIKKYHRLLHCLESNNLFISFLKTKIHGHEEYSIVPDDEATRKEEAELIKKKVSEDRLLSVFKELKHSEKVSNMRHQQMLKQRLNLAFKTGDKRTVELLTERLKPIHE